MWWRPRYTAIRATTAVTRRFTAPRSTWSTPWQTTASKLGRRLLESGAAQEELDAIRQDAEAEMDEAVKFADASPYPDPATVLDDMYVTDNERCVAR